MAKIIDADNLKTKYPNRKSLNHVLDNAPVVSITEQIESIKQEMCDNYCKVPYKYSPNEWDEIAFSEESPCLYCPLCRL